MPYTRPVEDPTYRVIYAGADITADISPLCTELVYTDMEHGESDTVDVSCEDTDHRWKDAWYPELKVTLEVGIGYEDGRWLDCGVFELDEVSWAGAADTVQLKALATIITPALRTNHDVGYDEQTLAQIVEQVAARNGLTPRHDIDPAIRFDRVTQNHERDLPFLTRLAEDYNYAFAVRGTELHYWHIPTLEQQGPVATYDRRQLKRFDLALQSEETKPQGEVNYSHPDEKLRVQGPGQRGAVPGDSHRLLKRARTVELAERQIAAHLHQIDKRQLAGSLTLVGDVRLVAGVNLALTGLRKLDGIYHIERSTHRLSRSVGYETEVQIYRVEPT